MRLIIVFLFCCYSSFSQKHKGEYVVTFQNDTIYGKIVEKINFGEFSRHKYKIKPQKGKTFTIKPSEVKSFYLNHGIHIGAHVFSFYDSLFYVKLTEGRIRLYRTLDTNLYYISKDYMGLEYIRLAKMNRKAAHADVRAFINDKYKIVNKFDKQKGNIKNILNIINEYNRHFEILWGRVNYEIPRSIK